MNQHAPFLHPYDGMIPLSVAGYILGTVLLLVHLYALVKRQQVQTTSTPPWWGTPSAC